MTIGADAICKRLNDELTSTQSGPHDSPVAISRNALLHATLERRATTNLSKLTAPAGLARDWAQILAYRRQLTTELVTLSHYWKLDDRQGIKALGASKLQIHLKMSAIASRDGFKDCSRVGALRR